MRRIAAALSLLLCVSCASLVPPDPGRVLVDSAADPLVWIPAVTAGVLAATDADQRLSDWAIDHRPIFRSRDAADTASDILLGVLLVESAGTAIVADVNEPRGGLLGARRFLVTGVGSATASGIISAGKEVSRRRRPTGNNDGSFPSGHASAAGAAARFSNTSLDSFDFGSTRRDLVYAANVTLAWTVAWARVEAGKHCPTDVLIGHAVGRFTANVFTGFWFDDPSTRLDMDLSREGAFVSLTVQF